MKAKNCTVCGNELSADAQFCNYCGVAVDNSLEGKNKNQPQSDRKSQARFLSILAFILIAFVLAVYLFRDATPSRMDEIEGEWEGNVYNDDGRVYDYTLRLNQSGTEISGWGMASDETGGADAQVSGTYRNEHLNVRERGGDEMGEWAGEEMCYWELDLELTYINGEERLVGSYDGIECDNSGTITLSRVD
jgi:predicted nucleic acid-binding Zn ribbon protein